MRAQSAIDWFAWNAYDLLVDGESYRSTLKATLRRATSDVRAELDNFEEAERA